MKEIYSKSKRGFVWTVMSSGLKTGLGLLTIFVLTHFLGVEGVGMISILTVVHGFSETFVKFGVSQSIISRKEITKNELTSIFWVNLFIGVLVFVCINLLAEQIANFYEQKELYFYIRLLSFVFLIEPMSLIFRAILEKELEFPKLEKVNILKSVVMSVMTILLVLLGLGISSYIYGIILSTLISILAFLLIFAKSKLWFPSFHFNLQEVKGHYKFGVYVTGRSFFNYLGYHFDELIIGKTLGIEALGIYYFAKKLLSQVVQLLISSFNKISFPFFAKLKSDIFKFKKAYLNLTEFFASWSFFFFILVILASPYIISMFWGEQWEKSIFLVQIFALLSILQVLSNGFAPPALYVFNQPKQVFIIDLVITPLRLFLIFFASLVSIELVAITLFLTVLIKVGWLQTEVNKKLKMSFKEYFSKLKIPFENALLSLIFYFITFFVLNIFDIRMLEILSICTFILLYVFLFFKRDRGNYAFVKGEIINLVLYKKNA